MKMIKYTVMLALGSLLIISCGGKKDGTATTNASENSKVEKKSPDQEMSEKLVGVYFKDDETQDDGSVMKDMTMEYFKDGKFLGKAIIEGEDDLGEVFSLKFDVSGSWKIENGFIKHISESIKCDDMPEEIKKEMLKDMNKKNSADKIIELDDQKLITEDADGERETMKKRVQ